MRISLLLSALSLLPTALLAQGNPNPVPGDPSPWPQHSMERPRPPIVTPGEARLPVPAPSDAIVLFDGRGLAAWRSADSAAAPARWTVRGGYVEVAPGTGGIATRDSFGDIQLHIEWSAPLPVRGEGQERGNSGVFLMGTYEIQVLDSYHNDTYPDGQAGAIFGQFPPLVNPARPPGEWNSYDIVFHRPRFDAAGKLIAPARATVLFNGVLVQDDQAILGPTTYGERSAYQAHPDRLPIELQDHEFKVRYRNVWVRRLVE
ncbi:MAG TPA: DUF1080 domain-containing protein [Gemmatimonadales bacterium]|nr:DUF1080 domain-containing protein [Gemmatimonadales bacterium]